jgi:hypothetical protein
MRYDVFISFKKSTASKSLTPESIVAEKVYKLLRERRISVFYSEESLAECGAGQFTRTIEKALDDSKILILVGSCRENIESTWVEAEWDSFLNDIRSGHKTGELFILNCGGMNPSDLPLFLRRQQMFKETEVERLVQFVQNALPKSSTLNDLVACSLHCYRPEVNEDKIYLWTVHPSNNGSGFIVTAFWGKRNAKRLNSQVKKTHLGSQQAASDFVQSEIPKKLTELAGYKIKRLAKLLTPEAEALLCTTLGLDTPPKKRQSKSRGTLKNQTKLKTSSIKKASKTPRPGAKTK